MMDLAHRYLLELIAVLVFPIAMAFLATALAWRSICQRALFFVIAVVALWGIGGIAYPMAQEVFSPDNDGPVVFPSAQFNAFIATDIAVAIFGSLLLLWLRNGLRASYRL
jgi:hypothetical protein